MGKGHRDNHAARVKRGPEAFAKKARRRTPRLATCNLCGRKVRPELLEAGVCKNCPGTRIGREVSIGETLDLAFSIMSPPEEEEHD